MFVTALDPSVPTVSPGTSSHYVASAPPVSIMFFPHTTRPVEPRPLDSHRVDRREWVRRDLVDVLPGKRLKCPGRTDGQKRGEISPGNATKPLWTDVCFQV